jgi:glutamyl-Q tRNA(Asp) synthetase
MTYRGRFAPSPTGPLHFGSLVAAVASYLQARSQRGQWLVRMEDVDESRTRPGAADGILRTLEQYGFTWDGSVVVQTARKDLYREALGRLIERGLAYPCGCSRAETVGAAYPGTCRNGLPPGRPRRLWRLRTTSETIVFEDAVQGRQAMSMEGDFVLQRADGLFAYQLAVVVDDADQQITEVVRGADLLDSTPRQMYLQRLLDLPTPSYLHVPAAAHANGQKLSKQTMAQAIDDEDPASTLLAALDFLGQTTPTAASVGGIWARAIDSWSVAKIPRVTQRLVEGR